VKRVSNEESWLPAFSMTELAAEHGDHQVRLAGELDFASTPQLADRLVAIAGSAVVLDLSDLRFIDARGLAALVEAKQRIEQQGDRMELRGAHGLVARVFEICGLAHVLSR
jgi:anti-anti-sigma factor